MSTLINNMKQDELLVELAQATLVGLGTVISWLGCWTVAFICLGILA